MEYYDDKIPNPKEYNDLRISSGMGNVKEDIQIKKALLGSLYIVSVYDKEKLIGLARIIGDGGISFAITDVMVDKEYQKRGIANEIMYKIDEWFSNNTVPDCFIFLLANIPADKLYLKHNFYSTPKRIGMLRKNS